MAHVEAATSDGDTIFRPHTKNDGAPDQLMLNATFPQCGDDRLWFQFLDGGFLRLVPISIRVWANKG